MNIDSITNGVVIDHITAGNAMRLYQLLGIDSLDCSVAIIKNAQSRKLGKKDIIKIDADIDVKLDVLGYIAPEVTVNVIKDGKTVEKKQLELPLTVKNVIKCKNPRCITTTENYVAQKFKLVDKAKAEYACEYCDQIHKAGTDF